MEQEAFFQWREYNLHTYPGIEDMFAIPNGAHLQGDSRRRAMQWARLVRQGAKKGVHDIFLPVPKGQYHGLWMEMKAAKPHRSTISKEQKDWGKRMKDRGYMVRFVYGCEEAIAAVHAYYSAPGVV